MTTPDLLSSPEWVETILRRSGLDRDAADTLLAAASAAFRSETGQHISLIQGDEAVLDSSGACVLLLPEIPVVGVSTVTVDGDAIDDIEWSADGMLRGRWPRRYRSVTVVYDHGFSPVPQDVQEAVAERVAAAFSTRPGIANVQLGATSYVFDKGVTQKWADAVAKYRVTR